MPHILGNKEALAHRMRGGKFSDNQPLDEKEEISATEKAVTDLTRNNADILKRLDEAQRMMADTQMVLARLISEHQSHIEKMMNSIIQNENKEPSCPRQIEFDVRRGADGKIKTVIANITEE